MDQHVSMGGVAGVIQLSLAPVFLLTGLAGILSVLSARLGRIIDRARLIDRRIPYAATEQEKNGLLTEADTLWRRISIMNWSIRLAVGSALSVCAVVMLLFVGGLGLVRTDTWIAWLFIVAMTLAIFSLLLLLVEVSISTRKMRQGLEYLLGDTD